MTSMKNVQFLHPHPPLSLSVRMGPNWDPPLDVEAQATDESEKEDQDKGNAKNEEEFEILIHSDYCN